MGGKVFVMADGGMGYPAATKKLKLSRLNLDPIFEKKPRVEPAQPEYIHMGFG